MPFPKREFAVNKEDGEPCLPSKGNAVLHYLRFLDAIPLTHHRRRVQLVSCIEHRRLLL